LSDGLSGILSTTPERTSQVVDKDWRLITGCAVVGLVVAAVIFLYLDRSGEFDASLYTAFAILCPPSLLCIPFSEAMKDRSNLYAIWSLIGITNFGLYAAIGAAVVGLRKKSL
jgi:hypothetical protein